ncbi:hydrolase [Hanstruepera neustonica]|uniref:Hydrolase n=1 Tax=Hanstruepera neustonica TaxID=1445657 RepID=A0A2K1DWX6_9FLAO|nr:NUDIX domain-containing protein [Hanstruepera neustonica]PNQ72531.1 hydrolase [Hanstruepera neustonica]
MDEFIDIVDSFGKPTGQSALKSDIHKQGFYHNTAHIWLYTRKGDILLAQRAASKTICPLLWDVSVAGHVDAGETIERAAIRETQEEIGLQITADDLEKIGVFSCFQSYDNGITDNEFHHTFIVELKQGLNNLIPQPHEVDDLKLVSTEEFITLLEHSSTNGHFVAINKAYYLFVLDTIKKRMEQN